MPLFQLVKLINFHFVQYTRNMLLFFGRGRVTPCEQFQAVRTTNCTMVPRALLTPSANTALDLGEYAAGTSSIYTPSL